MMNETDKKKNESFIFLTKWVTHIEYVAHKV